MQRPRVLVVLGILTMLVGGFGLTFALGVQVSPYLDGEDHFVEHYRDSFVERPEVAGMPLDAREHIGDVLAGREWARRGIAVPLGVANALVSLLLFAGAAEALRGSPWGHGAWSWAALGSVPYTVVATAARIVAGRDYAALLRASASAAHTVAPLQSPAEAVHDGLLAYRVFVVAGGVLLVAFYLACASYLRRPAVRALYPMPTGGEPDPS